MCVNYGRIYPDLCEANFCRWEQTEDDSRLDCFTTRFRNGFTRYDFHHRVVLAVANEVTNASVISMD